MKKIGILGGTFDPPHIGHLIIAEFAVGEFDLERIYFCPAFCPPHKTERILSAPEARLEMVRISCEGNDKFVVSDIDIRHKRVPSYTVDLLDDFQQEFPETQFYLIIGADAAAEFTTWHRWKDILAKAKVICAKRSVSNLTSQEEFVMKNMIFSNAPIIEISSTEIRDRVACGKSIRYMVHPDVEKYIIAHNLYNPGF